ncbi:DUF3147 family protein [bacterium]|nr:DUF3147 family protein [bacterium]
MLYYAIKVIITAVLIVLASEIAKRSSVWGGLVASLPLVSYLALLWLYVETRSVEKAASLAMSVFWLVLPSLPFFVVLAALLRSGRPFPLSLGLATVCLFVCYGITVLALRRFI